MTLAVELSSVAERRLAALAQAEGVDLPTLATRLLESEARRLSPAEGKKKNQATLDLLQKWDAEEATDDPDELTKRRRELDEFMRAIDESRQLMEGPSYRKIYP